MSVDFRTVTNYFSKNIPQRQKKQNSFETSIKPITNRNILKVNQLILFLLILGLFTSKAFAENTSIKTVAGDLNFIQNDKTLECTVILNKKLILKFDCEGAYLPKVLGDFRKKIGMLDEVIILQEMPMGNACNGGPLHIIGLKKDQSYQVAGPLDFCGGKAPIIKQQEETISITFHGSPPNRGAGHIPTEKWIYCNGRLKKIK